MKATYSLGALGVLAFWVLMGCGDAGRGSDAAVMSSDPPAATVALPSILLEPDLEKELCAPMLNVSLYVKGPHVRGALVETLGQAGCAEERPHPRFYEFRRSLYTCGRMTHIGVLSGTPGSRLMLIDRTASTCPDDAGKSELEIVEQLPSGYRIQVFGSF